MPFSSILIQFKPQNDLMEGLELRKFQFNIRQGISYEAIPTSWLRVDEARGDFLLDFIF